MRIALVAPWFHPHVGGVESHVRSLAGELARRDHRVTVLTSNYARLPEKETMEGFAVERARSLGVLFRTPVTPAIRRAIVPGRFDVVHAHSPPPLSAYYAATAAERAGTPFIVTYHCDLEIPTPFGNALTNLYQRTFGRATMRRASKLIVSTETYAATSRAIWRYIPEVIPNPVDAQRFRPDVDGARVRERLRIRSEDRVVLMVARIVPHKGIEHLVEAAKFVPDAMFVIVGDGPFLPDVRRLAAEFGVEDRVLVQGKVPHRDLPEYYAACDVFVLPSVSRLEAFGIVALEAMATAKPVVVSDIPGVREVVTDGVEGLLAEPVNPEDLAAKIGRLLADPGRRRQMGARGREKVEAKFRIDRVADAVLNVYSEVIPAVRPALPPIGRRPGGGARP
ncbi:MAG TPA: glycosyltransferase family 4 protein [Thermoplasmata archaeon]|nr:glycosyltransferase family 4 protein [Thermoplasmata archaeon]